MGIGRPLGVGPNKGAHRVSTKTLMHLLPESSPALSVLTSGTAAHNAPAAPISSRVTEHEAYGGNFSGFTQVRKSFSTSSTFRPKMCSIAAAPESFSL